MLNAWWEPPEKLKSCDDQKSTQDVQEIWRGVSMQRHGKYCMHKEHRDYKNVEQRRDGVVVVGKDSSVSKEAERRCRNAQ
jgi:hypothetical protein